MITDFQLANLFRLWDATDKEITFVEYVAKAEGIPIVLAAKLSVKYLLEVLDV